MNLINEVLHAFLFKGVIVYLDDMLIFSKDYQLHVKLVRGVLGTIYQNRLFAILSKCKSHKKKLDFLGFRILGDRLISLMEGLITTLQQLRKSGLRMQQGLPLQYL